ncbi:unnamed protein product, partial [marine sediment metagenome]
MAEVVYLLGAGVNQLITDLEGLKPPLANNFFQTVLQSKEFASAHNLDRVSPVYNYISQHWKKSIEDLRAAPFNLEDIFTFFQLQLNEMKPAADPEQYSQLAAIEFLLKSFLAAYMSKFEHLASKSNTMKRFGEIIYQNRERTAVLTFNYDCIVEALIEQASRPNAHIPRSLQRQTLQSAEIPYDELAYSAYNWNRPLAYGIKFNEVQLHRAGVSAYVEGSQFYSHPSNKLYSWRILKLHGSLNWF